MKPNTFNFLLSLPLLLIVASLQGGIVAPQSILELGQTADLIVNGTASGIVQNGNRFDFSLQVSRVIKGDGPVAGDSIAAYWVIGNQGTAGNGAAGDVGGGIWFLQRTASAWRVIPAVQGTMQWSGVCFPAPPGPLVNAYSYSQAASVDDKLASEICSASESAKSYTLQLYALLTGGMDELKSPVPQVFYQRMANSSSAEQRVFGLSGLIRSGNASAVAAAAQSVSTVGGNPAEGVLLLSIREYFRATDADSVAAVGRAATDSSNPSIAFREAAAHALAAIHTTAALPFLATLLDGRDLNLRVEAVGGIGAFANGLPVQTRAGVPSFSYLQLPASAPYKTGDTVAHLAFGRQAIAANEASYVSFWKDWWSRNRASLGY